MENLQLMLCYPPHFAGRGSIGNSVLASVQLDRSLVSPFAASLYSVDKYLLAHDQASGLYGARIHYLSTGPLQKRTDECLHANEDVTVIHLWGCL